MISIPSCAVRQHLQSSTFVAGSSRITKSTHPSNRPKTSKANFTTSSCRRSHYQTLGIPRTATRSQIKSSFYKLSKMYHPDVANDSTAKEKFQAVSEAYAILADDRKRRAYDRASDSARTTASSSAQNLTHHHSSFHYTTVRRRGATHAWARPSSSTYSQQYDWTQRPPPSSHQPHHEYPHPTQNPFGSPHVQRATGSAGPPPLSSAHWRPGQPHPHYGYKRGMTDEDHVGGVSSMWRALQVIGVVMVVATVGGGFTANASLGLSVPK